MRGLDGARFSEHRDGDRPCSCVVRTRGDQLGAVHSRLRRNPQRTGPAQGKKKRKSATNKRLRWWWWWYYDDSAARPRRRGVKKRRRLVRDNADCFPPPGDFIRASTSPPAAFSGGAATRSERADKRLSGALMHRYTHTHTRAGPAIDGYAGNETRTRGREKGERNGN